MDNSTDQLPQYMSPRKKLSQLLVTLPEDGEISLPYTSTPLTPAEVKDLIIFGPTACSPRESCLSTLSQISSSFSSSFSSSSSSSSLSSSSSSSSSSSACGTPIESSNLKEPLLPIQQPKQPEPQSQPPDAWLINPNCEWTGHHLHRSRTAPAMVVMTELNQKPIPKPKFASQSLVRQSILLLGLYLCFGVFIYCLNRDNYVVNETHPVVDALYFSIVTMCTIGYGDITPNSTSTKLLSVLFVLVGFGFIDILLSAMVCYVLDLQEAYMLKATSRTRPGAEKEKTNSYIIDVKKGRMRIRLKVALALGVVVLCIGLGVAILHFVEKLGWLDSLYLSVMSVTTVGYGDRAFETMPGRIFASIWLLVSTLAVARAFLFLAEARVDKRNRMLAKWVLSHGMSPAEFYDADIDNNGFVSKSEYVVYKLKEMEKVSDKDIALICNQFDKLDLDNLGKITLDDLRKTS